MLWMPKIVESRLLPENLVNSTMRRLQMTEVDRQTSLTDNCTAACPALSATMNAMASLEIPDMTNQVDRGIFMLAAQELSCEHSGAVICSAGEDSCGWSQSVVQSLGHSVTQKAEALPCLCTACPAAASAIIKLEAGVVVAMGPDTSDPIVRAMAEAACEMIGAEECFASHSECASLADGGLQDGNMRAWHTLRDTARMWSLLETTTADACVAQGLSTVPGENTPIGQAFPSPSSSYCARGSSSLGKSFAVSLVFAWVL